MKRTREWDETLDNLDHYCREIKIELYGGNDVVKAFEKFWALRNYLRLSTLSFTCNGVKVTLEKIKS
jgi:hypothetical protein